MSVKNEELIFRESNRKKKQHSLKEKRKQVKKQLQEEIKKNQEGDKKLTIIKPKLREDETIDLIKRLKVAAYCRVSTQEEAQLGSFEMQKQHFKTLIETNPNYELVKIYSDEGISGTSIEKRKGFIEMIEDAEMGKIDLILTKSISRFGRNLVDILTTLRKLGQLEKPVSVYFESEGINTSQGGNQLIISILSALAELESQQKSISVSEGIRYRMREGIYKFSIHNTLGYYRDYKGEIKIEPSEAKIVKTIYRCFLEGYLLKEIASFLESEGISSPMGNQTWKVSTIKSILSNEKYCGDVLYQKTYSTDFLTKKTAKNDNQLTKWLWENNHPPIIEKEVWKKVQILLKTRQLKNHQSHLTLKNQWVLKRIKKGHLAGFILLDMAWTKAQRNEVLTLINKKGLKNENEEIKPCN